MGAANCTGGIRQSLQHPFSTHFPPLAALSADPKSKKGRPPAAFARVANDLTVRVFYPFIRRLKNPLAGLALSGNTLFAMNGGNTIGEYDATTGACTQR